MTAHYDHLGRHGGRVHPGADDNASGVSTLLTLADFMRKVKSCHSIAFVATDAEEKGLYGAKAFLYQGPVAKEHIKANLNLDMLGHSGRRDVLYLGGPRHYPELNQAKRLVLGRFSSFVKEGRDGRGFNYDRSRRIDYRNASDHAVFDRAGIPFIFLNGADHKYYHSPRDTLARIDRDYFFRAVDVAKTTLMSLDQTLSGCPGSKES
ncbi:Bacterial leucyl aminopeptidase [Saliniradius amylolyticus]|uniref:Bacterial leucyl aminopeptidase n=1 Tax=Saliniradius amylolyticus TaxID=2183582 RepID=A0A2S2E5Z0_9ALTE|nr:M28 family peptidase [Saliniradius amylolyticus]AWL13068.1 Bacterial leucyl aminopeptidase [Saliniradius amylolyticus]